jgi:hypothetical protein
MSTMTFIGAAKVSDDEIFALDYLGRMLAHQDVDLVVSPKGQGNTALIHGYNEKAAVIPRAEAMTVNKVFDYETDQLLVYGGDDLTAQLHKHSPGWDNRNHIHLVDEGSLISFIDLVLHHIRESTGEVIEKL